MSSPAQRFGETRTGQPICTYFTDDHETIAREVATFTAADSFDAHALFEHLIRREIRKNERNTMHVNRFREHSRVHVLRLKSGQRQHEMANLSLTTIIGVAEYGKSRADHIFID